MADEGALADVVIDGRAARATLRPDRIVELCRGHFPGDPLVPGAMLVGVMAELASVLAGVPGRPPTEVVRAVFLRSVVPGTPITVTATRDGGRVDAEVHAGDVAAARGAFRFTEPA